MTINYQFGKIYTLTNSVNTTIYVGSSAQPYLSARMTAHRASSKDLSKTTPIVAAMRLHGAGTFKMLLHHVYPCNSRAELEAEEYRILDEYILAGRPVYNQRTAGNKHSAESKTKMSLALKGLKHSDATKDKMSLARKGEKCYRFNSGSIYLMNVQQNAPRWVFKYILHEESGLYRNRSFTVNKYGFWGAKNKCDELRKTIYPEYKDDEERCIEAFGNISLN